MKTQKIDSIFIANKLIFKKLLAISPGEVCCTNYVVYIDKE